MNTEHPRIGTIETVYVDGNTITGKVYNVRDNGWACVETESGRCASGPSIYEWACMSDEDTQCTVTRSKGF